MSSAALTATILALAAPNATPVASAPLPAAALKASLGACLTGVDATDRSASFVGSMPTIHGARRMAMRFDLYQRIPPRLTFTPVSVPGLGVWQRSDPGKPGFVFTQRVQALAAPAVYKAVVRFRWYGRGGRLLRSVRRETPVCRQPDLRPDLRAGRLTATPGPLPDSATYQLVVRNDGRSTAAGFDVVLSVNQTPQPEQRLAGLDPRSQTLVSFIAPRCRPGGFVRFVLDAGDEIAETAESDDVVDRPCPIGR